jgi:hypothetical protein
MGAFKAHSDCARQGASASNSNAGQTCSALARRTSALDFLQWLVKYSVTGISGIGVHDFVSDDARSRSRTCTACASTREVRVRHAGVIFRLQRKPLGGVLNVSPLGSV